MLLRKLEIPFIFNDRNKNKEIPRKVNKLKESGLKMKISILQNKDKEKKELKKEGK